MFSPFQVGFGRFTYVRANRKLVSSSIKELVVIVPRHRVHRALWIPNKVIEAEEWSNIVRLNTKNRRDAGFSALTVRRCSEKLPKKARKESTIRKVRTLFNRYWYIVIPVYLFLDVGSASVFYLLLTSGFDLAGIMKFLDMNEQSIEKVEKRTKTPAGRLAIVFILLKLTAPIRYALTLALSTLAIGYLGKRGFGVEPKFLRTIKKFLVEKFRKVKYKR